MKIEFQKGVEFEYQSRQNPFRKAGERSKCKLFLKKRINLFKHRKKGFSPSPPFFLFSQKQAVFLSDSNSRHCAPLKMHTQCTCVLFFKSNFQNKGNIFSRGRDFLTAARQRVNSHALQQWPSLAIPEQKPARKLCQKRIDKEGGSIPFRAARIRKFYILFKSDNFEKL